MEDPSETALWATLEDLPPYPGYRAAAPRAANGRGPWPRRDAPPARAAGLFRELHGRFDNGTPLGYTWSDVW
eukprot:1110147-Alexandrium_andersonii.AAC.1